MISYTSHKFKDINKKIKRILIEQNINVDDSEGVISDDIINEIEKYVISTLEDVSRFVSVTCPICGKKHLEPLSSTYKRNIIFKVNNRLIKIKIPINRLKCTNCNSTHAILPIFCIPFKRYSKQAVLDIVAEASKANTEKVANSLNIDAKQIRRFVNIFKKNKNNILLISKTYPSKFNKQIHSESKRHNIISNIPDDFDKMYFNEFKSIFLYIQNKRKIYIGYHELSL